MLDILLWVLFLTIVEGGAVVLMVWLWEKIMNTDSELPETLYTVAFIFALIVVVAVGLMLITSAVLGTMKLFEMFK